MENATKAILLGAGIVITLVLVSLGFLLLNGATGTVDTQLTDMESQKQQILEQKFTKYDGKTVNGSEVVNALQEFKDDEICVRVSTLRNNTVTSYYVFLDANSNISNTGSPVTNLDNAKDKSNDAYINPSGKFEAEVLRDENDLITGIAFDQQ